MKRRRKRQWLAISFAVHLVWQVPIAASKTYEEAHEACLRAIDYLNCISIQLNVESNTQKPDSTPTKNAPYRSEGEACFSQDGVEYCIAKKGKDIFGLPKPVGWVYRTNDNGSISYDMTPPRKVNVRGLTNRYFEIKNILRYYSQGRAGTASRQITLGSQSTNCTGNIFGQTSSYSIDCTTSPATTLNLPGREAEFPGVKQKTTSFIVDCKDKTFATYYETQDGIVAQSRGWKTVEPKHVLINQRMAEHCSSIDNLPLSTFYKYAE